MVRPAREEAKGKHTRSTLYKRKKDGFEINVEKFQKGERNGEGVGGQCK